MRAGARPRRTLLGALFDVINPMKVSESPCGATFTTGVTLGWHPACRRHRRPAFFTTSVSGQTSRAPSRHPSSASVEGGHQDAPTGVPRSR
jgi:hypothetical protein